MLDVATNVAGSKINQTCVRIREAARGDDLAGRVFVDGREVALSSDLTEAIGGFYFIFDGLLGDVIQR